MGLENFLQRDDGNLHRFLRRGNRAGAQRVPSDVKANGAPRRAGGAMHNLELASIGVAIFSENRQYFRIGLHHYVTLGVLQLAIHRTGHHAQGSAELHHRKVAANVTLGRESFGRFIEAAQEKIPRRFVARSKIIRTHTNQPVGCRFPGHPGPIPEQGPSHVRPVPEYAKCSPHFLDRLKAVHGSREYQLAMDKRQISRAVQPGFVAERRFLNSGWRVAISERPPGDLLGHRRREIIPRRQRAAAQQA